ncbi:hypothetical protein JG687_00005581 [Phytophthora cactorum]|uniref:Dynein heavy chain coiled coil stalk domain-containing protein n=1 Tax=Phytophthora cactorum TaxID=29920 RepID=A0A8T1UQ71_9STRA|nr:hypothetical protein JG687_00005581 [Phytophthora cactorum]
MASIKRRKCKQLTKFVTLVDFLLLDAFSEVVKRSLDLFHAFVLRGANAATITRLTDHDDLTLAMHQTVNVARQSELVRTALHGADELAASYSQVLELRQHNESINFELKARLFRRNEYTLDEMKDDANNFTNQEATLVIKRLDLLPMAIINQIQALMTTGEVPGILSLEEQVHLATRVCDERLLALKSQHAAQVAQIRAEAEASRDQALAMLHQKQRDAPTTPMLEAFQQVETRYQRELRSKLARVDLRYQQDSDDLRRQREVESESVAATVMALTRPLGVTSGKWASAVARMCSKLRTVLLVDKEHEQQVRTASPSIFSTCDVVSVPPLDRESLRTLVLWGVACMATDMHLAVINALKDEYLPTSRIFAMAEFFDRDLGALRSSDKLLTEQLSTIDQQLVYDEEKLVEQKQDAERIRVIMQRFRTAADEQILVTTEAQEQAQKELREPMNCLEEANRALLLVDRRHIVEIKSFVSPPPLVQLVLGAVCVLFQLESSWESARRLLLGDANFVQNLLQFNKDAVSAATLSKLETEYLSDERFRREEVERQSVAAASMVGWVRAIHQYATSRQKVQPTLDKLQKAQGRLQLIMQEFQVSKDRVVEADGTWQTTQAAIDTATTKKEALKDEIASLGARCDSGDCAMEALKEDRKLQNEAASAISMRRGFSLTTWNALLSAGALALQEVAVLVDTPEEQEDFLVEDSEEDEDDNEVVEQQDEGKLLRLTDVKDQHVRQQIVAVLRNEIPPGLFGQGSSPPPPISSTWSLHDAIQHYQDWHKFLTNTTRNVHPSRWWLPGILATGLSLPYILDVTQQNPSSKTPVQFTLRLPPDCDEDDAEPPEYPTAPIPANTFAMINGVVLLGAKWNGSLQSLDQVDDLQRHQRVELVCFVSTDTDSTTTQRVPLLASHDGSLLLECALPVDPNGLSPLATPFLVPLGSYYR